MLNSVYVALDRVKSSQLSRVINPFIAIEREQPTLVKSKIVAESCANARGEGGGA